MAGCDERSTHPPVRCRERLEMTDVHPHAERSRAPEQLERDDVTAAEVERA
jgi:hypothetical protein